MPPNESSEAPKYNLPPVHETGGESANDSSEQAAASPETASQPKSPKASKSKTQLADFSLKNLTTKTPASAVSSTSNNDNPAVADDNDLIEKEWVDKAKKIIEDNREDPYNQSKEITTFKTDYMKKRYNKTVKVGE